MVDREQINLYLDSFMNLYPLTPEPEKREELISLAQSAENLKELIALWLWNWGLGQESMDALKAWFGLRYSDLEEIFGLSSRQVAKLISHQRFERLRLLGFRSERVLAAKKAKEEVIKAFSSPE